MHQASIHDESVHLIYNRRRRRWLKKEKGEKEPTAMPRTDSTDAIISGNEEGEKTTTVMENKTQREAEKSAVVVEEKFCDAKQENDDHDDDDGVGKLVSKDTMETAEDSDIGPDDAGASLSKSSPNKKPRKRAKKKKKEQQQQPLSQQQQHSHPHGQSGLSNKLTKLLPGYVAPMKLLAPSLDRYRALPPLANGRERDAPASLVAGLDALRRKAIQQDSQTTRSRTNSVQFSMKHHAQVMLQKTTSSSATSYVNTHASFKRGTKRPPMNHAGEGWFNMQATPMTAELERDLLLIRNRNYLDPKRFYKSADNKKPSKFVQSGTVIEGATEFYSSRLAKRQRRGNLVEEVMAESSSLSNHRKQNTSSSSNSGGHGAASRSSSSADYVMQKYKNMQQESTSKAQAWHKRNNAKGRRKPQRK